MAIVSIPSKKSRRVAALFAVIALAVAALIGCREGVFTTSERFVDESRLPHLPDPDSLAPVHLPHFHRSHPRLPAPGAADIARLRKENPAYLAEQRREAQQKAGDLNAAILMTDIEHGSQDLERLHRRLLALRFADRGNEQTKPLAVAYDWLYDRWNPTQRKQLRDKLVKGCTYEIQLIRNQRLSPYNVYLYNSPLQALMACAIAVYGDDPRGDAIMAFTADLWKNRVLPVWRQIMGKNGGWHEGGEYVGIGIGQAIYELPAMWRQATGEDYFKTEPGIRSFLDFLIYRTRPDGSHFRWGDAGYFHRISPDRLALALEYQNAAAYSLLTPPKRPTPTGWPWGPLSDNRLYDPKAISRLPLARYFDGLGLIVARSDWSADATYVTFKAGDNYWSHSHLDQGAFTIYKDGALAIDSGLYGPYYGADHHMNYTYQTIAHNTITVTDPADRVPGPAPGDKPPRPIANEGGQRRIGSGWGVEAAPLDLAEWQAKRDIYHTGTIEKLLMEDGFTVAVANLTPAYTNDLSGKGTFSHRTRRVESYHRVFGYDSHDDVIVIFDRVTATKAEFRKRWLLHALEKPDITKDGFIVHTPPTRQPGHAGGRLEAHVFLPHNPNLRIVGGPGSAFFVDGKNYEHGVAENIIQSRAAEPGAWRVELMPGEPKKTDEFLVVLLPTLQGQKSGHRIHHIEHGNDYGVEIVAPTHTTRWWFNSARKGVHIEIRDSHGIHTYDLLAPSLAPPMEH